MGVTNGPTITDAAESQDLSGVLLAVVVTMEQDLENMIYGLVTQQAVNVGGRLKLLLEVYHPPIN